MIEIRKALDSDFYEICTLNDACFPDDNFINPLRFISESFVAIDKEKSILVGCILGLLRNEKAYVQSLGVRLDYRRKGIAFDLLSKYISVLSENDIVNTVQLHVSVKNITALNLYEKLNFIVKETISEFYYYKTDENDLRFEDAYLMERRSFHTFSPCTKFHITP